MNDKELQKVKEKFLVDVCNSKNPPPCCALNDSYKSGVTTRSMEVFSKNTKRKEFQEQAKSLLSSISSCYKDDIGTDEKSDDWHISKIEEFRRKLQNEFRDILHEQHIRFGVAQKMLNLYLKHLWATNTIKTPPHCPFDRFILWNKLSIISPWTKMDDIDEYKRWVADARKVSKNGQHSSISEWELVEFQNRKRITKI